MDAEDLNVKGICMRVLVVDVNFEYKNPMYRQFYTALFSCMEVDFFGPGYVSRECLEKGIPWYLSQNEKYSAILLGNYFVYSIDKKGMRYNAYNRHRHTVPYYAVNDAYQCCGKIFEELMQIKNIIKIFLYYEDCMSMPNGDSDMCRKLIENNFYLLSWPMHYLEKYSKRRMRQYWYLKNNAYDLAEGYKEYYLPIPLHGIGYHEIFVRNFLDRGYEWCIPGNRNKTYYPERNKAQTAIEGKGKSVWKDDPFQTLSVEKIVRKHMEWYQFRNKTEKLLTWMWKKDDHISSHPKMQYIAACREQYMESMRSAKLVYAEGSAGNCFVRKYFEACACGAVLVAKRVPGMSEMGFVHEKNCIIVEKYEDILDIDERYPEKKLEKIAREGQALIINKHMYIHRAEALKKTIEAITEGVYKGAFWKDGNYVIKRQGAEG